MEHETTSVITRMTFAASPEQVWGRLMFYEQIDETPPLPLRLLLPVPTRTEGRKSEVGDEARCIYQGGADPALFRTGWFVESLATQTLVIFVIRTADRPWRSRPSRGLAWGVTACATVGALLPFTPAAPWLGFTPLPPLFFAVLLGMVVAYLGLVEVVKRWFYRRYPM